MDGIAYKEMTWLEKLVWWVLVGGVINITFGFAIYLWLFH